VFDIHNFEHYCPVAFKIKTKIHGVQPFKLRKYQLRFLQHLKDDFSNGIVRSISLKPRQAGWSTLIAGINTHAMATRYNERGIMLADKFARTSEVHGIYSTFVYNMPKQLLPMVHTHNSEEIVFDNPLLRLRKKRPGLGSGVRSETAQDPNAGRSGTRMFAHLTEYAFYPYAAAIDEGVQNSIPLARGTRIFKESTANGMGGYGKSFFDQWNAAVAGESIYRPFFVAWYEIDDYAIIPPRDFILTREEINIIARMPAITNANLYWRRLKISEYTIDPDNALPPDERFKQDYPSYPEEAFLFSGRPVFDIEKLRRIIDDERRTPSPKISVRIVRPTLSMFPEMLTIYEMPKKGKKYFIGADTAEGIETGDSSSACILDDDAKQVAFFHGKIDPDLYGTALVELARVYNNAFLVPEKNNMGHTVINAIKKQSYYRVYHPIIDDVIDADKETEKLGWVTTAKSKQKMINALIAAIREDDIVIRDASLLLEMSTLTREPNGNIILNGKDKTVAACLALMGMGKNYEAAKVFTPGEKKKTFYETKDTAREEIKKA
jgi:hypothetical protein